MEKCIYLAPLKFENKYSILDRQLIDLLEKVEYTGKEEFLEHTNGFFLVSSPDNFIISLSLTDWTKFKITINVKTNEIENLGIVDISFGQPAPTNPYRNIRIMKYINELVDKGVLYLK